ncbi:MAG: hypothetical protein ABI467_28220 [Kofleriaceae bacterium]
MRLATVWLVTCLAALRAAAASDLNAPPVVPSPWEYEVPVDVGAGTLALVGGIAGGMAIHDDHVGTTTGELFGGFAGAVLPMVLVQECLPVLGYRNGNPVAETWSQLFAFGGIAGGFVATTTLGGLGTWGAGELESGSRSRNGALGGAMIGAGMGALGSIVLTKWLANHPHDRIGARTWLATSIVAATATFGYQLGGGGPR